MIPFKPATAALRLFLLQWCCALHARAIPTDDLATPPDIVRTVKIDVCATDCAKIEGHLYYQWAAVIGAVTEHLTVEHIDARSINNILVVCGNPQIPWRRGEIFKTTVRSFKESKGGPSNLGGSICYCNNDCCNPKGICMLDTKKGIGWQAARHVPNWLTQRARIALPASPLPPMLASRP